MQKLLVVAVGKLKERFWEDACKEYLKRLRPYADVEVRELPDSTPEREEQAVLRVLDKLPAGVRVILLDIRGTEVSSTQLAQKLEGLAVEGVSQVVFIIGGSDGVTPAVKARAHERLSFGPITLPHNLARVVLLEQLYRAQKIIRHEPYHK